MSFTIELDIQQLFDHHKWPEASDRSDIIEALYELLKKHDLFCEQCDETKQSCRCNPKPYQEPVGSIVTRTIEGKKTVTSIGELFGGKRGPKRNAEFGSFT